MFDNEKLPNALLPINKFVLSKLFVLLVINVISGVLKIPSIYRDTSIQIGFYLIYIPNDANLNHSLMF